MAETKSERRPRRAADGRLATVGDLVGVALAGLVCGIVVLLVFEGIMSLTRLSEFGETSGWLTDKPRRDQSSDVRKFRIFLNMLREY